MKKEVVLVLSILVRFSFRAMSADSEWDYGRFVDSLLSEDPDPAVLAAMGNSGESTISNGWVVVDGALMPPPYRIMRNANGIKINGRLVGFRCPVDIVLPRYEPPSVPDDFPSDCVDLFSTDQGISYFRQCEEYLISFTTNDYCVADDMVPFMQAIPAVSRVWTDNAFGSNPLWKRLCVEWSADTNSVEYIDVYKLTKGVWPKVDRALNSYEVRLETYSRHLERGGLLVSLRRDDGIRDDYKFSHDEALPFLVRMKSIADGELSTNEISTTLASRPFRPLAGFAPLFERNLSSFSALSE